MKERYWTSICQLAEEYKKEAAIEEAWPPNYHHFDKSDICVMIFKGSEEDCKAISEYLNERPMEGDDD